MLIKRRSRGIPDDTRVHARESFSPNLHAPRPPFIAARSGFQGCRIGFGYLNCIGIDVDAHGFRRGVINQHLLIRTRVQGGLQRFCSQPNYYHRYTLGPVLAFPFLSFPFPLSLRVKPRVSIISIIFLFPRIPRIPRIFSRMYFNHPFASMEHHKSLLYSRILSRILLSRS